MLATTRAAGWPPPRAADGGRDGEVEGGGSDDEEASRDGVRGIDTTSEEATVDGMGAVAGGDSCDEALHDDAITASTQ